MSYDNNKNRIEERVYSVTMTEEELSLFSEFLEQKEFEREDNESKARFYNPDDGPSEFWEYQRNKVKKNEPHSKEKYGFDYSVEDFDESNPIDTVDGLKKTVEKLEDQNLPVEAQVTRGKFRQSASYVPSSSDQEDFLIKAGVFDNKHRMSRKFVSEKDKFAGEMLDRQRELNKELERKKKDSNQAIENRISNSNSWSDEERKKYPELFERNRNDYNESVDRAFEEEARARRRAGDHYWGKGGSIGIQEKLNKIADDSKDIINKESDLAKSKYDDKYSSKRVEKWLDKKIDADKAKNIVDRRHSNDSKYQVRDTEKGRNRDNFHISDINRKWEDTGIVYNEALGRNLNKDAAIAAGVTASLVGGGIALKKYLKKKKQEKELAENKYKTSDKKKKK